jgi:LuxR family maltose regulon positive regulatory protein
MPPLILSTKLYIPPYRPNLVPRPRLQDRLKDSLRLGRKLTLISAPAGFGKTTLVIEWIAGLASSARLQPADGMPEVRTVWLSLDQEDNDLSGFFTYLVAALQGLSPSVGKATQQLLENNAAPPADALLLPLVNDLAGISGSFILALDDYHTISLPAIHAAMAFLIEHQPPQMHIVITTRQDPLLPLARWRARGQVTEIRLSDLRFTQQEAADFLNHTMRLNLQAQDIDALESRTEGWIAGLQLAAVSLQQSALAGGETSRSGFIHHFAGDDRFVMDYLIDEVLLRQPEDVQKFLLETSILERFNAGLCEAVLAEAGFAQNILDYLDRSNLFLIHLDNRREWYRYHHLFAELLRHRLTVEKGRGAAVTLHQRAARWYAENGFTGDSVFHAGEAKDYLWLADLLEKASQSPATWSRGEFNRVLRWMEMLPPEIVESRPRMMAQVSRAYYLTNDTRQGLAWHQKAEAAVNALPPSPEKDHLLGVLAVNRTYFAMIREEIEEMIADAKEALRLLPEDDPLWRCRAQYALALGEEELGNFIPARQYFERVADLCLATGNTFLALNVMSSLAYVQVRTGQLHQAELTCRKGLKIGEMEDAEGSGGPSPRLTPAASLVLVGLGAVQFERNELDAAEKTMLDAVALAGQGGIDSLISTDNWLGVVIRARLALGRRSAAEEAIHQFDTFVASSGTSRHQHISYEAQRARMALALGDFSEASAWARRYEQIGEHEFIIENPDIVLVRVYLAEKRFDEALARLDQALPGAEKSGYFQRQLEILILRALTLSRLGRSVAARDCLLRAVEMAAPEGYMAAFAAEGAALLPLVEELRSQLRREQPGGSSRLVEFIDRLASAFTLVQGSPAPRAGSPLPHPEALIEPLSDRELEVLRLIGDGLSNGDIAQKLYLSPNTLKAHTQNIYSKLDVYSRVQAVNRARDLGLL